MKNIVGQTPRGKDFYPRDAIINSIYRRLDGGSHLYLSAPRRAGKTSVMRALEDSPREGYIFIYFNVEDCYTPESYYQLLVEELETSLAQGKLAKLSEKAQNIFQTFFERTRKIKLAGLEIEMDGSAPQQSYAKALEQLLREIQTSQTTIVIMVDEFPIAVENIAKAQGKETGLKFLHTNRSLRQRAEKGVRFIYTGSIGLPNVARRLGPAPTVNDLSIVEIPPLSQAEGLDMSHRIFKTYGIQAEGAVLHYLLDEIKWLMPFFIQLLVQMLIDESEARNNAPITQSMVDQVLEKAANHRNNIYFTSYYDRLDKALPANQRSLAKTILAEIAEKGLVPKTAFVGEANQRALEMLEYEGYIHELRGELRFNSPILRMWWRRNT